MTIKPFSEIRRITGISDEQLEKIEIFLQGAVYSWVKNQSGKRFAARDLMGGENLNWKGTPLLCLYDFQIKLGKDDEEAFKSAGVALGWILKDVLHKDKRVFKCEYDDRVAHYLWDEQST